MNAIKLQEELLSSMEFAIDRKLKHAQYNATIEGVVVSVLGNNQYTVKINNIAYTVPGTAVPASEYKVGMIVWIEVPWNNFSQKYIKCQKPY